uniref:PCI domain-containing protein n=1 Tax=Macrostomum lignano TaxID=282301 RepID=A0A1I8IGN2_9PLAT
QQSQTAVTAVLDVLRQDEQGQSERCYFPYLACMQQVLAAAVASAAAAASQAVPVAQLSAQQLDEQRKLMRLMKLCLERSDALLNAAPPGMNNRTPQQPGKPPPHQAAAQTPAQFAGTASSPIPPAPAYLGPRKSPMQEAMELNRRLYSAHLARTSALPKGDPRRVNLHLALQRRIEENLQLAKPKQAAFEQALQDDLLAKRTDCSRLFQLHTEVFEYDDGPVESDEEKAIDAAELRTLYCRCSEFDYLVLYRDQLYQKSAGQPPARLQYVLSIPDHPLAAFIAAFSDRLANRLSVAPPTPADSVEAPDVELLSLTDSLLLDADRDDSSARVGRVACRLLRRLAPAA